MKKLRVILADDHALVRAGIRALIESVPGVAVAGEAGTGKEALILIGKAAPDIVLLDVALPDMSGLRVAERIAADFPGVKVIILSMHQGAEFVLQAFKAGVSGYIVKDAASGELAAAIHAVGRGETYLSPAISRLVIQASMEREKYTTPGPALTARQRQVLRLMVDGRTTKEIALTLKVSVKTVEAHRAHLMERLDIRDLPGLVRYAMRTGLTPPEAPDAG
ncbi:MAG TPA: response regulator transcription factor [Chthoniobacteraceae bacterium]|jgi:DNA-binding NarL/FixJ family response regulator|nr:response regulator transcription factor [Chthoniobacteraceae bacterium]